MAQTFVTSEKKMTEKMKKRHHNCNSIIFSWFKIHFHRGNKHQGNFNMLEQYCSNKAQLNDNNRLK
jgi:hypothetical protein